MYDNYEYLSTESSKQLEDLNNITEGLQEAINSDSTAESSKQLEDLNNITEGLQEAINSDSTAESSKQLEDLNNITEGLQEAINSDSTAESSKQLEDLNNITEDLQEAINSDSTAESSKQLEDLNNITEDLQEAINSDSTADEALQKFDLIRSSLIDFLETVYVCFASGLGINADGFEEWEDTHQDFENIGFLWDFWGRNNVQLDLSLGVSGDYGRYGNIANFDTLAKNRIVTEKNRYRCFKPVRSVDFPSCLKDLETLSDTNKRVLSSFLNQDVPKLITYVAWDKKPDFVQNWQDVRNKKFLLRSPLNYQSMEHLQENVENETSDLLKVTSLPGTDLYAENKFLKATQWATMKKLVDKNEESDRLAMFTIKRQESGELMHGDKRLAFVSFDNQKLKLIASLERWEKQTKEKLKPLLVELDKLNSIEDPSAMQSKDKIKLEKKTNRVKNTCKEVRDMLKMIPDTRKTTRLGTLVKYVGNLKVKDDECRLLCITGFSKKNTVEYSVLQLNCDNTGETDDYPVFLEVQYLIVCFKLKLYASIMKMVSPLPRYQIEKAFGSFYLCKKRSLGESGELELFHVKQLPQNFEVDDIPDDIEEVNETSTIVFDYNGLSIKTDFFQYTFARNSACVKRLIKNDLDPQDWAKEKIYEFVEDLRSNSVNFGKSFKPSLMELTTNKNNNTRDYQKGTKSFFALGLCHNLESFIPPKRQGTPFEDEKAEGSPKPGFLDFTCKNRLGQGVFQGDRLVYSWDVIMRNTFLLIAGYTSNKNEKPTFCREISFKAREAVILFGRARGFFIRQVAENDERYPKNHRESKYNETQWALVNHVKHVFNQDDSLQSNKSKKPLQNFLNAKYIVGDYSTENDKNKITYDTPNPGTGYGIYYDGLTFDSFGEMCNAFALKDNQKEQLSKQFKEVSEVVYAVSLRLVEKGEEKKKPEDYKVTHKTGKR